jgi:hypothetical protein
VGVLYRCVSLVPLKSVPLKSGCPVSLCIAVSLLYRWKSGCPVSLVLYRWCCIAGAVSLVLYRWCCIAGAVSLVLYRWWMSCIAGVLYRFPVSLSCIASFLYRFLYRSLKSGCPVSVLPVSVLAVSVLGVLYRCSVSVLCFTTMARVCQVSPSC